MPRSDTPPAWAEPRATRDAQLEFGEIAISQVIRLTPQAGAGGKPQRGPASTFVKVQTAGNPSREDA